LNCHLVTGGSGFIGSCYILQARSRGVAIVNLDKLTYAGNQENLISLADDRDIHSYMEALKIKNLL